MGAGAGDGVVLHHCDPFTHLQGAQAVGNHNDGLAFTKILDGPVNLHLVFRVGGAGGRI